LAYCIFLCVIKADLRQRIFNADVSVLQVEYLCSKYKPDVEVTRSIFQVGRTSLTRKLSSVVTLDRCCALFKYICFHLFHTKKYT